jgi:hypothetical protein
MSSPVRPYSADGDGASDLARVMGDGDDDRDGSARRKRARTQERRAIRACFRCRQQKSRCPGGWPCVRCVKANKECDFGKENVGNIAHPLDASIGTAQHHEQQYQQERRVMQACFRCRQQKLRCTGGKPCARCVKANKECDFGRPGQAPATPNSSTNTGASVVEDGDGAAAGARLDYLESRVVNLLAGLHRADAPVTDLLPAPSAAPVSTSATATSTAPPAAPVVTALNGAPAAASLAPRPSTYDTTALANIATPALLSTSAPPTTQGLVRFVNSPEVNFISPLSYSGRPETTSPSGDYDPGGRGHQKDNQNEAEERLASSTKEKFEAPFQALVYQVSLAAPSSGVNASVADSGKPSVWENREASKRSTPLRDTQPVHPSRIPLWDVRDGPITSSVVDLATARTLYTLSVIRRPALHL